MASTPSSTVRFTIAVTPEVHATFSRLAAASSSSLSKTVGEWLESTAEGAELMATQFERFKAAPHLVMTEMHAALGSIREETGRLSQIMKEAGQTDRTGLARDARSGRADRLSPPLGNTGGKVPSRGPQKPVTSGQHRAR